MDLETLLFRSLVNIYAVDSTVYGATSIKQDHPSLAADHFF